MTWLTAYPGTERMVPFLLFALYLITAVRICRYSSWIREGAPNPFLPRHLSQAVSKREIACLLDAEMRQFRALA